MAAFPFLGGFAEVVEADAAMVFPLPERVTYEQGAALPMNYLTCHFALRERGGLREGETVLVHGAAGGIGTAAVQLAAAWGARVIAVVSSRRQGARSPRRPGPTRSCSRTASGMPSPTSPADAASTSSSTPWAATASPTRCARSRPGAGCSSSGSPPARSPRSRSTGCCWATSPSSASAGARGGPAPAARAPAFLRRQWDDLVPLLESGAVDPVIGEVRDLDERGDALTAVDERRADGRSCSRPEPAHPDQ